MLKTHPHIFLPLFFIGFLCFLYGLVYFFRWDHENSVSEWLTVILYIAAAFYYMRHNRRHFGIFPVLVIFLILLKELSWLKFAFQFFEIMSFYQNFLKDAVFRLAVLSLIIAAILADLFRVRDNIVIFLQQRKYLYFFAVMAVLGTATQIIDKMRGSASVWASFEEAGEVLLPIMLLVMFYMLKSETIFRELGRK